MWKHLEAFGSLTVSAIFKTVLTLKRQISENSQASKCFQNSSFQMLPNSEKTVQNSGSFFVSGTLSHFFCRLEQKSTVP
jgi:hypothetical protein